MALKSCFKRGMKRGMLMSSCFPLICVCLSMLRIYCGATRLLIQMLVAHIHGHYSREKHILAIALVFGKLVESGRKTSWALESSFCRWN